MLTFSLFSLFVAFIFCQPTQYPVLPNSSLTLPTLNRSVNVLITGGKQQSIALATALIFDSLGATVTITTRNPSTYNYALIAGTNINVIGLDLGGRSDPTKRAKRVAKNYRQTYGKNPDIYVHSALTIANGDPYDYESDDLEYFYRQYVVDPMEIEREFLSHNDPTQQVKVVYVTTYAGIVYPPYYQTLYNERARFLLDRLEASNAAIRFPNWEYLATLCVFTNTTAMINSVNPSAEAGDYAQQQFQTIFTGLLATLGLPASYVGNAVAQAALLRSQLNYETIFDASGPYSASIPSFVALRGLSGKNFTLAYRGVSLAGYGINITKHTP